MSYFWRFSLRRPPALTAHKQVVILMACYSLIQASVAYPVTTICSHSGSQKYVVFDAGIALLAAAQAACLVALKGACVLQV